MKPRQNTLSHPILVIDGDCAFCRRWADHLKKTTGTRVDYIPFQTPALQSAFPLLDIKACQESVHFIRCNGEILHGAEAVFQCLEDGADLHWPIRCYRNIPGIRPLCEWSYRLVANHRAFFSMNWLKPKP